MRFRVFNVFALLGLPLVASAQTAAEPAPEDADPAARPNIVLVMADDMGWGQTGYYNHPVLQTPNLDEMAAAGLRFDRFYAGAPVCSPTRASVLTGRTNRRTGVESHGYALRRQEKTLPEALRRAGYATGHFGKWHLNGMRGPGVPIFSSDTHHPGMFGFDEWLSVTNFFDRNPIMSRQGEFVEFQGDSSEIIIDEALTFIRRQTESSKPFFAVVWYGSPHDPFVASEEDQRAFGELPPRSSQHYGELVAMDRSIGTLRRGLRDLKIADDTLVWFCSDNGGLPNLTPESVGGLRGHKGTMYEGGLRVPAIIEWPAGISEPRVTHFPAVTMDIFPTIAEIIGLPETAMLAPQDGVSLKGLLNDDRDRREKPIPFSCFGNTVLLDNDYKLIHLGKGRPSQQYELYNLVEDPKEQNNLYTSRSEIAERLRTQLTDFQSSLADSIAGKDYPEGQVREGEPSPEFWMGLEAYRPYLEDWKQRPEYGDRIRRYFRKQQ